MGIVCSSIILLVLMFSKRFYDTNWNPLTMFLLYWFVITFFSNFQPGISDKSYVIVVLGCVSYAIGFLLNIRKRSAVYDDRKLQLDNSGSSLLLIALFTVALIIDGILASISLVLYRSGLTWAEIRGVFLSGSELSPVLTYLKCYIAIPCSFISGVVFSVELFLSKKSLKRTLILLITALSTILYGIASEGRFVFLYFFVCIYIASLPYRKLLNLKYLKIFITIFVCVIFGITLYRQILIGSRNPILGAFSSFIGYAMLPIDFIQYYFPIIDKSDVYGNGMVFWGGFVDALKNALNIVGVNSFEDFDKLDEIVESFSEAVIINGEIANSFVSLFTYFYLDGRLLGVVVGSFIYGLISSMIYNRRDRNLFWYSMFLFLWVLLCMSPVRWGLYQIPIFVSVIYLFFFYRRRSY